QRPVSVMTRCGLVADAGGTNVRFALVDLESGGTGAVRSPRKYVSRQYPGIADAARAYLREHASEGTPCAAVIAVAGPVSGGAISMTNLGWRFSESGLGEALGIGRVRLINDFEAIAHAVPVLSRSDVREVGAVRAPPDEERETVAIVGPGTGLGVGGFVKETGRITPLVTEGGHSDFAPNDEVEIELLRFIRRRHGHASAERLLSGPGLVAIYEALKTIEGSDAETIDAHDITLRALEDADSFCAKALSRFCAMLGSFAGDVALMMGARHGVMLAGGILPAVADFFAASRFRSRFEAKGRFEGYMKAIPTRLIVQEFAGLIGAAAQLGAIERAGG
ncbi:MAG TPA: glucokinase, partial [Rhizomicrobium sp.]|nr:glucokinase [Rhizomicrobium sp.]